MVMKISAILSLVALAACTAPRPNLVSETRSAPAAEAGVGLAASPPAGIEAEVRQEAQSAVRRALPFLEREGIAWMEGRVSVQEGQGCVSCHHVGYALWSHKEARQAGITGPEPALQALADTAIAFLDQPSVPRAMSAGHVLIAESGRAQALGGQLLKLQNAAGDWAARGQFPTQRRSIAESDAVATMYALLALSEVDGETTDPGLQAARGRALDWLEGQPEGESTEWLAWRLVLSINVGGDQSVAAALHRTLAERQRPDGGWGWTDDAPSDAFSTGQALYALATFGKVEASAIERAARFLVSRQGDDGSWRVPSAVISSEPSEEKDVIYHFWGTAWAAIGLARALSA